MGWLEGWLYRKAITLSRADGAVTNYQMKLFVDSYGDYSFRNRLITNDHKLAFGSGDTDNRVLTVGSPGAWDDEKVINPHVVEKDGTVYLYYAGHDGAKLHIGVATAPTAGFNGKGFTKSGNNPILTVGGSGTWDESWICWPFVIYDAEAGIWKMWYAGYSASNIYAIGYATSNNPDSGWTKHGGNPILIPEYGWEGSGVRGHSVLKLSSTEYKMLYAGGSCAIGLATSSDGIAWTKYGSNPVISASGTGWEALMVLTPRSFRKVGDEYRLMYVGKPTGGGQYSKIGYAYSSDLMSWTRGSVNPVLGPTKTWEKYEVENPIELKLGNTEYIYYDCWFATPPAIGGAILDRASCNNHVLSNFNDLRFTAADGTTVLDYWIESIVGSGSDLLATVWVEFDSIGTGDTSFYMYYGKSDAPSYSNGVNTFIKFEDFEWGNDGDSLATGGNFSWSVTTGASRISTEQKYGGIRSAKLVGATGSVWMVQAYGITGYTMDENSALMMRIFKENATVFFRFTMDLAAMSLWLTVDSSENLLYLNAGGSAWVDTGVDVLPDAWQLIEWTDIDTTNKTADLWLNGTKVGENLAVRTAVYSAAGTFFHGLYQGTLGNDAWIDNIIIRNWRAVEPVWGAWGGEEEFSVGQPASKRFGCVPGMRHGPVYRWRKRDSLYVTCDELMIPRRGKCQK